VQIIQKVADNSRVNADFLLGLKSIGAYEYFANESNIVNMKMDSLRDVEKN